MNSATSSAPRVLRPTGLRSMVAQTFCASLGFGTQGEVVADHSGMIDRPDRADGGGSLQGGQGDFPIAGGQQAKIVTHRPTP